MKTLDNYNDGEDPSTTQIIDNDNNLGSFNSIKEALQYILNKYNYDEENLQYFDYDGESINGDILVNENDEEVKKIQKNGINLKMAR